MKRVMDIKSVGSKAIDENGLLSQLDMQLHGFWLPSPQPRRPLPFPQEEDFLVFGFFQETDGCGRNGKEGYLETDKYRAQLA